MIFKLAIGFVLHVFLIGSTFEVVKPTRNHSPLTAFLQASIFMVSLVAVIGYWQMGTLWLF